MKIVQRIAGSAARAIPAFGNTVEIPGLIIANILPEGHATRSRFRAHGLTVCPEGGYLESCRAEGFAGGRSLSAVEVQELGGKIGERAFRVKCSEMRTSCAVRIGAPWGNIRQIALRTAL